MTPTLELHATECAICHTTDNSRELYPARFSADAFNEAIFSARRTPDRIHYRFVRCNSCGLTRADPVADARALAELYARSRFDYSREVPNLKATYGRYLRELEHVGVDKSALLEIGCGNGFLLEEAVAQGFRCVRGVEPSEHAVARAREDIRPFIIRDVIRPGVFGREEFAVICLFQVLDHISNPAELLDECFKLLKPGGLILCLNHNVEALSARLLRNRSPIVDIEHTYLYSPSTIARLFSAHGFNVRRVGAVRNIYSLRYIVHLTPTPLRLKRVILAALERTALGRFRLALPLGNLHIVAQRPAT